MAYSKDSLPAAARLRRLREGADEVVRSSQETPEVSGRSLPGSVRSLSSERTIAQVPSPPAAAPGRRVQLGLAVGLWSLCLGLLIHEGASYFQSSRSVNPELLASVLPAREITLHHGAELRVVVADDRLARLSPDEQEALVGRVLLALGSPGITHGDLAWGGDRLRFSRQGGQVQILRKK